MSFKSQKLRDSANGEICVNCGTMDGTCEGPHAPSSAQGAASVSTTARTWFADERELRQLCGDAQSQARSEGAQDFAADMMVKANQYGLDMYLSQKQLDYLCTIADWDVPKRETS